MKITRSKLQKLIESYISVVDYDKIMKLEKEYAETQDPEILKLINDMKSQPELGLAPLHDTKSRQAMDLEALNIAKEILTREGYGEHAKDLDDTGDDNLETINSLYNLAKAFDKTGMLTPVHDQAIEIMFNIHDDFEGQTFALDIGKKPVRQYDFSQFNHSFGKYNPEGVVDINTGKTVPSVAIQVSYKTYDHMDPNYKETLEDVVSSIEIPAHIVTNAYGNYILWKGKSEQEDIYNDQASAFLFAAEKLSDYIEDYVKDFLSKNYPNQNLTAFQIRPADERLQDVIRRSADVDNLP